MTPPVSVLRDRRCPLTVWLLVSFALAGCGGWQPGRAVRCHGLPRRARTPQLLEVRRAVRTPGPHVPARRQLEPARPPVRGLGVVGALLAQARPAQLRQRRPARRVPDAHSKPGPAAAPARNRTRAA